HEQHTLAITHTTGPHSSLTSLHYHLTLFLPSYDDHGDPHSFPTRRSSDLIAPYQIKRIIFHHSLHTDMTKQIVSTMNRSCCTTFSNCRKLLLLCFCYFF